MTLPRFVPIYTTKEEPCSACGFVGRTRDANMLCVDCWRVIVLAPHLAPATPAQRHASLDELLAAFLNAPENRNKLPSTTPIMELVKWSHAQLGVPS